MKKIHLSFAALTSLLFASATWSCTEDRTATDPAEMHSTSAPPWHAAMPNTGHGMTDQFAAGCPMVVPGTEVSVADTESGVALTFTTNTDNVAALRTGVQHMAQMYESQHEQAGQMWYHMGGVGMPRGGPHMGMGGAGMGHSGGRGPMPAASTTMTAAPLGARLEFRPTDPSQLDALRAQVRWHQERMHSGDCWVLQEQPTKIPAPEEE